jgi:hypothetical protein
MGALKIYFSCSLEVRGNSRKIEKCVGLDKNPKLEESRSEHALLIIVKYSIDKHFQKQDGGKKYKRRKRIKRKRIFEHFKTNF